MAAPYYSGDYSGSSSSGPYMYDKYASIPPAFAAFTGFTVITTVHICLFWPFRAWHFWGMYIGLLMECVGHGFRAYSVCQPDDELAFNISYVALLVAPTFISIGCFSTFGRIMWWITPLDHHQFRLLWCHPRVLAPMLMTVGILSAVVQFIGACFLVSGYKDYYTSGYQTDIALNATRSGLAVHLAVLTAITIIGLRYILVSRRWIDRSPSYALRPGANWRLLSWTIYAALIAVVIHTGFRLAELLDSNKGPGYLMTNEWPFWVCDVAPMLATSVLLAVVSPCLHLPVEFLGVHLDKTHVRNRVKDMHVSVDAAVLERLQGEIYGSAPHKWV